MPMLKIVTYRSEATREHGVQTTRPASKVTGPLDILSLYTEYSRSSA
jgi:hypothetical protein